MGEQKTDEAKEELGNQRVDVDGNGEIQQCEQPQDVRNPGSHGVQSHQQQRASYHEQSVGHVVCRDHARTTLGVAALL